MHAQNPFRTTLTDADAERFAQALDAEPKATPALKAAIANSRARFASADTAEENAELADWARSQFETLQKTKAGEAPADLSPDQDPELLLAEHVTEDLGMCPAWARGVIAQRGRTLVLSHTDTRGERVFEGRFSEHAGYVNESVIERLPDGDFVHLHGAGFLTARLGSADCAEYLRVTTASIVDATLRAERKAKH